MKTNTMQTTTGPGLADIENFYKSILTDLFCATLDSDLAPEIKDRVERIYLEGMNRSPLQGRVI